MTKRLAIASTAGLVCAAGVSAQSASVSLVADDTSVAPGSSVAVSVVVDYTVGGAGAGVFGPAGLYGFGGSAVASGSGVADASASSVSVSSLLPLGPVATAGVTNLATVAGGRLLTDGGLPGTSQIVATFDVDVDAGAADGSTITIDYDGAVVLSLDNELTTYSTDPGANQMTLTTVSVTLTVGGGRLCGDVNGDGNVSDSDFFAWVTAFVSDPRTPEQLTACDVNTDGECNDSDFFAWVTEFIAAPGDRTTCPSI
ncbi:MAG: dockerin type I domain-containing protein [Planctomycetota bacterium]